MDEYKLIIGQRSYSSWSLRGWLLFRAFGIDVTVTNTKMYSDTFKRDLLEFHPATTVPAVKISDGAILTDSIAIAEELAQRHPHAGLLPDDPIQRARARSLMAEMHSGFHTLRDQCPMNTRLAYKDVPIDTALKRDLERLEILWGERTGTWLCGDTYTAADAFYAPVAARIAAYSLPMSDRNMEYAHAHLNHRAFRQFRAMGMAQQPLSVYDKPFTKAPWPGPQVDTAKISQGPSVNDKCPYSGDKVTDYLEFQGRIYGFCNSFCRDKTIADPYAWPAFIALTNTMELTN